MVEPKEFALLKDICYNGILVMLIGFVVVLVSSIVSSLFKRDKKEDDEYF